MDLLYSTWRECAIEGGGHKWQLREPLADGTTAIHATVVWLPGTLARVFWPDGRISDHETPAKARYEVEERLTAA